jgi:hypothetical protein
MKLWENINKKNLQKKTKQNKNNRKKPNEDEIFLKKIKNNPEQNK